MQVQLDSLPMHLSWLGSPPLWSNDNGLTIDAPPASDWFIDPSGAAAVTNAPALVGRPPDDDFLLAARVTVDAAARFDAGVLFVYADDTTWAKLCLERSPDGRMMVVSVVTRGTSDDCNSHVVDGDSAWLRVARSKGAFAFHASDDGVRWQLIRHFGLPAGDVQIGFEAQSPTGDGCRATFADIAYASRQLTDLRDES
jgi:regulation of enolase protein 1 (concanavalin A-like superfamily)